MREKNFLKMLVTFAMVNLQIRAEDVVTSERKDEQQASAADANENNEEILLTGLVPGRSRIPEENDDAVRPLPRIPQNKKNTNKSVKESFYNAFHLSNLKPDLALKMSFTYDENGSGFKMAPHIIIINSNSYDLEIHLEIKIHIFNIFKNGPGGTTNPFYDTVRAIAKKEDISRNNYQAIQTILRQQLTKQKEQDLVVAASLAKNGGASTRAVPIILSDPEKEEITKQAKKALAEMQKEDYAKSAYSAHIFSCSISTRYCSFESGKNVTTNGAEAGSELVDGIKDLAASKKQFYTLAFYTNKDEPIVMGCKVIVDLFSSSPDDALLGMINNKAVMFFIDKKISRQNKFGVQFLFDPHLDIDDKKEEWSLNDIILALFFDTSTKQHFSVAWNGDYKNTAITNQYIFFYINYKLMDNKTTKRTFRIIPCFTYNLDEEKNITKFYADYVQALSKYDDVKDPRNLTDATKDYHLDMLKYNKNKVIKELSNYLLSITVKYTYQIGPIKYEIKFTLPTFYFAKDGMVNNWSLIPFNTDNRFANNFPKLSCKAESTMSEMLSAAMTGNNNNPAQLYL